MKFSSGYTLEITAQAEKTLVVLSKASAVTEKMSAHRSLIDEIDLGTQGGIVSCQNLKIPADASAWMIKKCQKYV